VLIPQGGQPSYNTGARRRARGKGSERLRGGIGAPEVLPHTFYDNNKNI